MNLLGPTLVMYLLVGAGVAVALYLSDVARRPSEQWFALATAIPFWPLYLPLVLARPRIAEGNRPSQREASPQDEMAVAIAQVDAELEAALSSLDDWAEDVLAREKDRIAELRAAWTAQAERVREMDRLLALPPYEATSPAGQEASLSPPSTQVSSPANERLRNSQRARRQNLERLRRLRQRAYDDLMGTLAWVRELVSMIHLAKFTGAPASRAEELVAQIAAAVEGLAEVTWQEEPALSAGDAH